MQIKYFKNFEDGFWKYARVFLNDSSVEIIYFKPLEMMGLEDKGGELHAIPLTKAIVETIQFADDDPSIENYEFEWDGSTQDEFMGVYDQILKSDYDLITK